jgi:hypothetical protein
MWWRTHAARAGARLRKNAVIAARGARLPRRAGACARRIRAQPRRVMPPMSRPVLVLLALLVLAAGGVRADEAAVRVSAPSGADLARLGMQRERVRELAALHLGRGLDGSRERDLETLQLLLDRGVVRAGETADLQAMGVVLGDLLAAELEMHWVIYEDASGRSRALRLGETPNFLFPVTMISRRVDVGIAVTVREIYALARAEMEPYIGARYRKPAPL